MSKQHKAKSTNETRNRRVFIEESKLVGVVEKLLNTPPIKRSEVKPDEQKPAKLIPPQSQAK